MGTPIFISDPSSGQFQVKRSNFQIQCFLLSTYLSCPVLPQDSNNVICFDVQLSEMQKMRLREITSSPFPGFWAIPQPKKKQYISLKFCTLVVGI